jgi:hypothetical protein
MKLNVLKRFVLVVLVPGIGTTCEGSRNTGSTKMHGSTVVLFIRPSSHWGERDRISSDSQVTRHNNGAQDEFKITVHAQVRSTKSTEYWYWNT